MKKLFGVFLNPSRVFESEKGDPNPWIPFVAVVIVVMVYVLITGVAIREVWVSKAMERIKELPPDQQKQALKTLSSGFMLISGILYSLILTPLKMFFTALYYTILIMIVGGEISYMSSLTTVSYANVISLLAFVIKAPLIIFTKNVEVTTSLVMFMKGMEPSSPIYKLASQVDFFTLWSLYVMGIGLSVLGGFSKKRGALMTYLSWLLWIFVYVFVSFFLLKSAGKV